MTYPADKPFASSNAPQDGSFSPPAPNPASAWLPPVSGAVDPESAFPDPHHRPQIEPDQAMALDLGVNQFLNAQAVGFKAAGEAVLVYRQKRFGQLCACVDPATNQPQDGCRICFNTTFVGGYDFIGDTPAYIGTSAMARKLTELGITLEQKPKLYILPNIVVKDRDFIVALGSNPVTDCVRFQQEPVVRAAHDPNIDPLKHLNARRVVKISLTPDGSALSTPNPAPQLTPAGNYDLPPQVGGGEDFEDGEDFILTGGELVVDNALTSPPNADARVLRILGKRAPLDPPSAETLTGQTIPKLMLYPNAGLSVGLAATVFCRAAKPQSFAVTLASGSGADAGFFLVTLQGAAGSGLSSATNFPPEGFLATVAGSAVLWRSGGRKPADAATFYVTYEAAVNATKRYQLQNVTTSPYQGVAIAQEADVELMDITHPIYGIDSAYDLGAPLDRQAADEPALRKEISGEAGLVTTAPNVADRRFVNPADFL